MLDSPPKLHRAATFHQHDHDRSFDTSYVRDVLRLSDAPAEHHLDERLHQRAHELGLDVASVLGSTVLRQTPPWEPSTLSRVSQDSMASNESRSTDMASLASEDHHDQCRCRDAVTSRASLSIQDYDAFLSRRTAKARHSISFSPSTTPSHSAFSLPLQSSVESQKRHFRRLRGMSILRRNWSVSSASLPQPPRCPHCSPDFQNHRRAVHQLPCGHKFCTQGLRKTINAATSGGVVAVPSCCGVPVPGRIVEHVMTQTEQQILLDRFEQWDEVASLAPSCTSPRDSVISRAPRKVHPDSRTNSSDSTDLKTSTLHQNTDLYTESTALDHTRQEKDAEQDRFQTWAEQQRLVLEGHHHELRRLLQASHQAVNQDLKNSHAAAVSDAEDKQVMAEADLRTFHYQERRDNATALKHMEAYCAGTYSTGELHHRTVTDQDRAELDKTRQMRDQMDIKHDSQINVLRGEQSRRMRSREHRQESELRSSMQQLAAEAIEFEHACATELQAFMAKVEQKRHEAAVRLQLQTAISIKEQELVAAVSADGNDDENVLDPAAFATANFGLTTPFTMLEAA